MPGVRNEPAPTIAADADTSGYSGYARFLRPRVSRLLATFGMDIVFHRAEGDYIYYYGKDGREIAVLDLVGGFGASLFGHNHPELLGIAQRTLADHLPFNAQASVRGRAGRLAEALSERVGRFTGRQYVTTLASTGTEAVEAAIKHAELERFNNHQLFLAKALEDVRRLRIRLRAGTAYLPHDFLKTSGDLLCNVPFETLGAMLQGFEVAVNNALNAQPQFLAIAGDFHGKSTGSLQLTYREEFRNPWKNIGVKVAFVPSEDQGTLERVVDCARINLPEISYEEDGRVALRYSSLVNVAACFCEPIQGEGGIHELSPRFLQALRSSADAEGFPLVIDEIQTGMGRCGTFLASERTNTRGDYYLLSKSLGGGLSKISALLVDSERYQNEFGYLHTSTFADDDYSSTIALGALALMDRDDSALIKGCSETGEELLNSLRCLQERFPEQIRDVRGRGLMIGVELAPQTKSSSPLLRVLSEQNGLSYLVSGYLLHEHAIRVAPTLADRAVIRIEPSAYFTIESCKRFCGALEHFLTDLRDANAARLLAFAMGSRAAHEVHHVSYGSPAHAAAVAPAEADARVAFLVHFSTPADLQNWEVGLSCFEEADCARFLDRIKGLLHPFILHETEIRSSTGKKVDLVVIGVPFTAAQAVDSMRDGSDWCLDLVREGVETARAMGCTVVGLGGHTSIVSNGGRSLVEDKLVLTNGNSLTVAAAHEAIFRTAKAIGLDLSICRLGVVGAAGNVGAALAELATDEVGQILLIGRKDVNRFLRPIAQRIYASALQSIAEGRCDGGIPRAIRGTQVVRRALSNGSKHSKEFLDWFCQALADELGEEAPIRCSDSMEELKSCELVVSATNSPHPVVSPCHIGYGNVVVCDVAVPQDVESRVEKERPQARVIRGGTVRAPLGQILGIPAIPLRGSELYGCLAETMLLGFVGCNDHFSYGPLSISRVRKIREWAAIHGFEMVDK